MRTSRNTGGVKQSLGRLIPNICILWSTPSPQPHSTLRQSCRVERTNEPRSRSTHYYMDIIDSRRALVWSIPCHSDIVKTKVERTVDVVSPSPRNMMYIDID